MKMNNKKEVVNLPLEDILPNRFQPRIRFDEKAIVELSESIKEHGVIQPIIVRGIGDKYEIIAGERRYKASVMAGKTHIPSIIVDLNDKDSSEIALIENVQRQDLTPIEEAISYRKILDMGYLTQEDLATKLGVAQSTVANKLRLLNLDDEVQDALLEEKISERHARSLLKLEKASMQREMLKRIIEERLTVRKTDEEIDKMMNDKTNSILDSIENTMMNNQNNFSNNDMQGSPFVLNNENNSFNSNAAANNETAAFNPNVSLNEEINNFNINNFENNMYINPETNPSMDVNIPSSSDIEIIDFADSTDSSDSFNIPSMPIVEDEIETVPTTNVDSPLTENINSFNSFNVEDSSLNSVDMNVNNNMPNITDSFNTPSINEENNDDDSSDERILRPGRFFNILNYDNEEQETNENIQNNETVENTQNTFNFDNFNASQVNEENNDEQISNSNINQNLTDETPNNEQFNPFNQSFDEQQPIETPAPVVQNEEPLNNFNYNAAPVTPVYEDVKSSEPETKPVTTLRDVINLIRKCADEIEQNNFEIDTEEFDFDDIYQVIFKIKK